MNGALTVMLVAAVIANVWAAVIRWREVRAIKQRPPQCSVDMCHGCGLITALRGPDGRILLGQPHSEHMCRR